MLVVSKGADACGSSKRGFDMQVEKKTYDYVISLRRQISQMEVVKDCESRPHKAVSMVIEREKEILEWNE